MDDESAEASKENPDMTIKPKELTDGDAESATIVSVEKCIDITTTTIHEHNANNTEPSGSKVMC
jgi:hypothetical protein